jgi:PilZ domain
MAQNELRADANRQNAPSQPLEGGAPVSEAMPNTGSRHYSDLQSAARFPIKLPIAVKSQAGGESHTETTNISANGVLFQLDSEMPVGSAVNFTISLPGSVLGSQADVQIDCRGRVARSFVEEGHRGIGVVIDEYHFERG